MRANYDLVTFKNEICIIRLNFWKAKQNVYDLSNGK